MATYDSIEIRAAHVPRTSGGDINDPSRSLACVQLHFKGLVTPSDRTIDGIVTVYIRDDGTVLGPLHEHPVEIQAEYVDGLDEAEPVTDRADITPLSTAADQYLQTRDLPGIWQDSRMFALYHETEKLGRDAHNAVAKFHAQRDRYTNHITMYYQPTDSGELAVHDPDVQYIIPTTPG